MDFLNYFSVRFLAFLIKGLQHFSKKIFVKNFLEPMLVGLWDPPFFSLYNFLSHIFKKFKKPKKLNLNTDTYF
ncbi:unnamed protein product [Meloidogyne enterolobii]|uniref:Uncharacterized protein n=1 Tax=Meloidogyne enterolobii TaxID=390850 RepID=A0ACB0Z8T9_MELEN